MSHILSTKRPVRRGGVARLIPADIALLCVMEFALSVGVLHLMLKSSDTNTFLPGGAIGLAPPGENLVAVIAFLVGLVTLVIGLYHPEIRLKSGTLIGVACLGGLIAFPLFLLMSGLYQAAAAARGLWLVRMVGVWLVTVASFRLLFSLIAPHIFPTRRMLLLGNRSGIEALIVRLQSRRGRQFEPLVAVSASSRNRPDDDRPTPLEHLSLAQLRRQRIWGIVLASNKEPALALHLLDHKLMGIKIFSNQAFQEQYLGRIDVDTLTVEGLLFADGFTNNWAAWSSKRVLDLLLSVAMLVLVLPLMTMTALAIKLDSPGPVFYRQRCIGYLGRPFTLLKFRSMTVDAEAGGAPRWTQKQDPRTTRVGAFIRATRIDALPQLANVIQGEMSLVGPRPERPHFVEQLSRTLPFYRQRNYVKPGVTGWAQVNFPYGASVEDAREKLAYDLYYVKHKSLLCDLRVLLATVRVVLTGEGVR